MILVGYHTRGGYKLYDPTNKQVVINKDVMVDEIKEWNWNTKEKKNSTKILLDYETTDREKARSNHDNDENNRPRTIEP